MKVKTPSYKIVLYKSTQTSEEGPNKGKYPVKLRVIYDRRIKYYSLGVYTSVDGLTPPHDEGYAPTVKKGKDNEIIRTQYGKAKKIIEGYIESGKEFTFTQFEKEYQVKGGRKKASEFIQSLIDDLVAEDRHSTASTYRDCLSSLERYKAYQKVGSINQIDLDFLKKYSRHLHARLSTASVGIHLRTLRAIVNSAIRSRLMSKDAYPFRDFKGMPSTKSRSKKALTKDRIGELVAYWKKLSSKERYSSRWQALSLYLFSYCVAGINLEDIIRLKTKNLDEGIINFTRQKSRYTSGVEVEIPLIPIASEILADFTTASNTDYLFPYLEEELPESTIWHRKHNLLKKVNADLKAIANDLGIPVFTFYTARHSMASILYNEGASVGHIGELMVHTSEKTTKNYLASIQSEKKKDLLNKLI